MTNFTELFEDCTSKGRKIKKEDYLENGRYPIIDQGQEQIAGYSDDEEGLFTEVPAIVFGDHTRIIKYVHEPFFLGADGVKVLRCKNDNANYKYLYYALKNAKIPNTGYNRHFKWLKETKIAYPDITKQDQITLILDKLSKIISYRKQQLDNLDNLIKSRFVELFGTYPRNEKGWRIGTIRDIVSEVRYGSSRPSVDGGKYPYLRMNNITYSGELDLSDVKQIDVPDNELPKCTVRRGDVLFNRTNSKELVGKTCVYNRDELMVLAGFVVRVRVDNKLAMPEFLSIFMNMDFTKRKLFGMCKAASGQANINAQELQDMGIYIPPIEIQGNFLKFKNHTDKLKFEVKKSLDETQLLFDSLMQIYFE